MSCVTRIQVLRGTTTQRLAFTPLVSELVFDTTLNQMFVGDGTTAGGIPFVAGAPQLVTAATDVNLTVTNQNFVRVFGSSPVTITVPATGTTRLTIKNTSSAILTIVPPSGTINDEANLQIKARPPGSLGNSVDLIFQGGQWWVV